MFRAAMTEWIKP